MQISAISGSLFRRLNAYSCQHKTINLPDAIILQNKTGLHLDVAGPVFKTMGWLVHKPYRGTFIIPNIKVPFNRSGTFLKGGV